MIPSIPLRLLRTQSDARLVELARDGHERAFEALVTRYRRPLLGYCRRMLLPESRAEDALQQGLLQAWLALSDGCEVRDAKAWLFRIVHNAAISARRRSGYDYVELDESLHAVGAPDSDIDRRIAVREALAGLAALPEAQREVLLRTAVHGHSHEQVAAELGLSDGAVRGLIYRARATLRAGVTALTPPQLVVWAARAAESGSAHPQLAELIGTTGSAGAFGVLLKGGAVVLSAGVLASGAGLVAHGGGSPSARAASASSTRHESPPTVAVSYLASRLSTRGAAPVAAVTALHAGTSTARRRSTRHRRGGGTVPPGARRGGDGRSRNGGGSSGDAGGEPGLTGAARGSELGSGGSGGSGDRSAAAGSPDGPTAQGSTPGGPGGDGHGGGASSGGGSPGAGASAPAEPAAASSEPVARGDAQPGGGGAPGAGGSEEPAAGSTRGD